MPQIEKLLHLTWWILVSICGYRATRDALRVPNERSVPIMPNATAPDREQGADFLPKFDSQGLLTAIAIDSASKEVLMVAFMDSEALAKTRASGLAHFHSRSRGRLWLKGETSGHFLRVEEIRVDCDQDALVMLVRPEGPACHTGAASCFYRRLEGDGLARISD